MRWNSRTRTVARGPAHRERGMERARSALYNSRESPFPLSLSPLVNVHKTGRPINFLQQAPSACDTDAHCGAACTPRSVIVILHDGQNMHINTPCTKTHIIVVSSFFCTLLRCCDSLSLSLSIYLTAASLSHGCLSRALLMSPPLARDAAYSSAA